MHVIFWDILSSVLRVRFQAHHLKSETELYEEKEQQLVNDCVKELSKSEGCDRFVVLTASFSEVAVGEINSRLPCSFRAVQSPDFHHSGRTGSEDWRCFQTAGGDHTPALSDCGSAKKGQISEKTCAREKLGSTFFWVLTEHLHVVHVCPVCSGEWRTLSAPAGGKRCPEAAHRRGSSPRHLHR